MKPEALLFYRSDQPLNHSVLLWGMGLDELLLQTVLVHRPSIVPRGKHQPVIATQDNWIPSPAQSAVPGNERLLQRSLRRLGIAAGAQPPAQRLSSMAVHDKGQGTPAVNGATPDARKVCCPPLIRTRGHRGQCPHPRPGSTAALAHLPALDLEQALDGVLVLTQQPGNGTVAGIG